jgi:ABC-2 type transport system permease protein
MRNAWLVAWREYFENARTRGFWIGLLLFPTILFIAIQVPVLLERKGTPTRYFALVDQSGQFDKTVEDALERQHQRRVLNALEEYRKKQAAPGPGGIDSPAAFPDPNGDAVDAFIRKGGKESYLRALQPRLRPGAPPFREPRRMFQRVASPVELRTHPDLAALALELKPYLRGEKKVLAEGREVGLFAAILVPREIEKRILRPGLPPPAGGGSIEYWSVNLADENLRNEVQRAVNEEVQRREYVTRGMDLALIQQVGATRVPFESLNPKKEEGQERVSGADVLRQWAPIAFVYLLWIAIFSIVQMLLNNVIEEKSNRIIEVLLSSVTPGELMMGKLAGIAAVGLTMVGTWLTALLGILAWQSSGQSEVASQLYTVVRTSNLLPAFVLYFFLGYVMYAAFILAIGSVCNTIKEAQNYMGVITMIMMVPMLTMMFIPKDPNGTLATVLSWIPLYTPFIMMNRAAADPPLFDLIGTMILLVASTALALWMSVKIFRIGVLRTGQPPRIIEMLRWLRT